MAHYLMAFKYTAIRYSFNLTFYNDKMTENNNDYRSQQSDSKSRQQTSQNSSSSPDDKLNNTVQDTEEREVKVTDQRRPQFRANENYRGRNF
jgi:hypothetical protein